MRNFLYGLTCFVFVEVIIWTASLVALLSPKYAYLEIVLGMHIIIGGAAMLFGVIVAGTILLTKTLNAIDRKFK